MYVCIYIYIYIHKQVAVGKEKKETRWISAFVEARPSEDYPPHWRSEAQLIYYYIILYYINRVPAVPE